jgi:hypothetical protein
MVVMEATIVTKTPPLKGRALVVVVVIKNGVSVNKMTIII